MLDNEAVKQEILNFIGEKGLEMLIGFYRKYKRPFPMIVEDGCPISTNLFYGMPIRNHIQEVFDVVPNKIKDWGTYEDYIYGIIIQILDNEIKKDKNGET